MAWKPDMFRLFVSHISQQKAFAHSLADMLEMRHGVHGFVAHDDIEPSTPWQQEIESSLRTMDALATLLHDGFARSVWCNQEVGWAHGRGVLIVPVMCGESPKGFSGSIQGLSQADGNVVVLAQKIAYLLASHELTAERMGVVTAKLLRNANSWEEIRRDILPQLAVCTKLNDLALDNIEEAIEGNDHVSSLYEVRSIKDVLRVFGRTP